VRTGAAARIEDVVEFVILEEGADVSAPVARVVSRAQSVVLVIHLHIRVLRFWVGPAVPFIGLHTLSCLIGEWGKGRVSAHAMIPVCVSGGLHLRVHSP